MTILYIRFLVIIIILTIAFIIDFCIFKPICFKSLNIYFAGVAVVYFIQPFLSFFVLRMVVGITVITI